MAKRLCGCLLLLLSGTVSAVTTPTLGTPWSVIAASDMIVVGTIENQTLVTKYQTGIVDIVVQRELKGRAPERLHATYGVASGISDSLPSKIVALRGKTVVVYLLAMNLPWRHNEEAFEMTEWFGMDVLTQDSPAVEQRVRDELAREPLQVSETQAYLDKLDGGAVEPQVQAAIESMVSDNEMRRSAGLKQLRALGCKAVPYIIKHLDDRRPFKGVISSGNTWSPMSMTDALSQVLWSITNGVRPVRETTDIDDEERRKVNNSWLLYLAHNRLHDPNNPPELPDLCN